MVFYTSMYVVLISFNFLTTIGTAKEMFQHVHTMGSEGT